MAIRNVLPRQIYKIRLELGSAEIEEYVLVISREHLNLGYGCTTVMFSSQDVVRRGKLPNCVPFKAGRFGLSKECVAKCESLTYTLYEDFIDEIGLVGTIDDQHWEDVVVALGDVFQACCEVNNYF